jgi:hypothetical protein
MKVTQSKNYKKPLYALGLAAAIAMTVTACGNELVQLAGDTTTFEPTESSTVLGGETTIDTDYTEPTDLTKYDGDDVALAGDVEFFDPDVTTEGQTEDTTEATS